MAVPFCNGCGAAVAEGTRFCVKCGQPVGQAAAAPVFETPPPPPPPPPVMMAAEPVQPVPPVKKGSGAGVWIGIFGILLLLGGAGLWFYTTHGRAVSVVEVAAAPVAIPVPSAPATPEAPPPNPDFAQPETPPPNPDFAKKQEAPPAAPAPSKPPPVQTATESAAPPPPSRPVKAASPTSGMLHAAVEVAQNGEVVFENLPGARLRFSFDHNAWKPTISRQANGTQTLVMRSLKPGIQTTCDVRWEIVP